MIFFDNLRRPSEPIVEPCLRGESEVVAERSVFFGFEPSMRRAIKAGVRGIIDIRSYGTTAPKKKLCSTR